MRDSGSHAINVTKINYALQTELKLECTTCVIDIL